MKLKRDRYDFMGALDKLAEEYPESCKFLADMQMYAIIGKDTHKLRLKKYGKPMIQNIRKQCEISHVV